MNTSVKTTATGWIIIVGDIIGIIVKTFQEQGFPTDLTTWITFGVALASGIGLLFAKDHNVSNSGTNAPAHTVPGA